MRKIVDTSVLRTPSIEQYLQRSAQNEIVVPQLVLCECLQGDGIQNARRSLPAIGHYSKQVLVLKADALLHQLSPRSRGMQARLIDERLTRGLRTNLLHNLSQGGVAKEQVNTMIRSDEQQADAVISIYSTMAERAKRHMLEEQASWAAEELSAMRSHRVLLAPVLDRLEKRLMSTTANVLQNAGINVRHVSWSDCLYSVPFRFALAIEALSLDWSAHGGLESRSIEALSNDLKDMSHVAYSTFFDGIITADRRMQRAAMLVRILLRGFEDRYANMSLCDGNEARTAFGTQRPS